MTKPQAYDEWHSNEYSIEDSLIEPSAMLRRFSEESIRTEDCEGPVPESPTDGLIKARQDAEGEDGLEYADHGEVLCTDRAELIERIKRGESPTWVPNRAVSEKWFLCLHSWWEEQLLSKPKRYVGLTMLQFELLCCGFGPPTIFKINRTGSSTL